MTPKNRVGTFCMFCGGLALIIFWASLYSPDRHYDFLALLGGAALVAVGWVLRTAKGSAAPSEQPAPPPPPKKRWFGGLFQPKPPANNNNKK